MAIKIKTKKIKALESLPRFTYILAIITALGLSAGFYRLYAGLGDTTNLSTVYPWGLWISFDLTTVAFAGAAFTLAALVYVFHMHELHAAVRPTVLFGLLGYSSVLVILFFDLGRWDRFWHFLVYPNLSSALFEVSWCIALYSGILAYELSPVILARFQERKDLKVSRKDHHRNGDRRHNTFIHAPVISWLNVCDRHPPIATLMVFHYSTGVLPGIFPGCRNCHHHHWFFSQHQDVWTDAQREGHR